ncbi:hypothetical protein [Salinifilum aidingensis]
MDAPVDAAQQRAERLEEVLHVPVLIAAAMSVPGVFLSALDGPAGITGTVVNWLSMLVLTGESALLFLASPDRLRWLREHWWIVAVTLVSIPAVVFAVGPAQVLRLVRVVTAVQVLKVGRLLKVARVVLRRGVWFGRARGVLAGATVLLAAALVGVLLADPDTAVRQVWDAGVQHWGWGPLLGAVVLAGSAAVAAGGLLHRRFRR